MLEQMLEMQRLVKDEQSGKHRSLLDARDWHYRRDACCLTLRHDELREK